METVQREHTEGYIKIKPRLGKKSVSTLVNFAEAGGAYGYSNRNLKRLGQAVGFFGIYIVICAILSFLIRNFFLALPVWILLLPVPLRLISIFAFDEFRVKKEYKTRLKREEKISFTSFFGAYDISDTYPTILYFPDGNIGVVLELVRRTQIGYVNKRQFEHSYILAEFYRQCALLGITPKAIDIQALNTKDDRFDTLYEFLDTVENPTLETILSAMYHHLEDASASSRLTYEYFLIKAKQNENLFTTNIISLRSILQGEGYRAVRVMTKERIASLVSALYGIKGFPIQEAMSQVSEATSNTSLRLLWLGNKEGKRKVVNKSRAQMEKELQNKFDKDEKPKNNKGISSSDSNELLNLFAEDEQDEYKSMTKIVDTHEESEQSIDLFDDI